MKVYPTAKIAPTAWVDAAEDAVIGDFVLVALHHLTMGEKSQINAHASLTGMGEVEIGKYVVVSYGVRLITGTDQRNSDYMCNGMPLEKRHVIRGKIVLEDNVFIGANAVVTVTRKNPEIIIGENSLIGAGSYIDKNVDPNTFLRPKQNLFIGRRFLNTE